MKTTPFAHIFILIAFLINTFGPMPAQAQEWVLPKPGVMVHLSPPENPAILKGIKVHPDNPFRFDFILDKGDNVNMTGPSSLKEQSSKLIKYFLASLTIPEKDLWVNLSPYEKDRIIPNSFGLTEMGRDLLAEDYMLKQITASLIYPEDEIGKKFWKRIYEEAQKKYGTTNIPVNTFNKVWIVPEKAVVYENAKAGTAYVVESKLKVMLEQDYLSLEKHEGSSAPVQVKDTNQIGSQIVREIVIPELTKEVNEGKNFSQLRQVYNSLILATWYKKKIKDSILSQVYSDRNKVAGVNIDDPLEKEKIYQQYLQAFKKGAYNYIKEEIDPTTQQTIPRKYFSGGVTLRFDADKAMTITNTFKGALVSASLFTVDCNVLPKRSAIESPAPLSRKDRAMNTNTGVDPTIIYWGDWLQKILNNSKGIANTAENSQKYETILTDIESKVTDSHVKNMVHNIWHIPRKPEERTGGVVIMDRSTPTAQHVLMALAFYIIWRSENSNNTLTQQEAAYFDELIKQYNGQTDTHVQLKTFTLFALALCPYFYFENTFKRISAHFLNTFDQFPDNSEIKVGTVATYLFLNSIHHTKVLTDANSDIKNDIQFIKFLMNQIKLGQLEPKVQEMAEVAVTRAFIFLIPWVEGVVQKEAIHLSPEIERPLRQLIMKNKVNGELDRLFVKYYPSNKPFKDSVWAGLSVFLYMGGMGYQELETSLVRALGRKSFPSIDILFLQPSDPQALIHEEEQILKKLEQEDLIGLSSSDRTYTGEQLVNIAKNILQTYGVQQSDPKKIKILEEAKNFENLVTTWFGGKNKLSAVNLYAGGSQFADTMLSEYPDLFSKFDSVENSHGSHIRMPVHQFASQKQNEGKYDVVFMLAPAPNQMAYGYSWDLPAVLSLLKPNGLVLLRLNEADEDHADTYTEGIEGLPGYGLIYKSSFLGLPNTFYTNTKFPLRIFAKIYQHEIPSEILVRDIRDILENVKAPMNLNEFIAKIKPVLDKLALIVFDEKEFILNLREEIERWETKPSIPEFGLRESKIETWEQEFVERIHNSKRHNGRLLSHISPFIYERDIALEYFRHNILYGKYGKFSAKTSSDEAMLTSTKLKIVIILALSLGSWGVWNKASSIDIDNNVRKSVTAVHVMTVGEEIKFMLDKIGGGLKLTSKEYDDIKYLIEKSRELVRQGKYDDANDMVNKDLAIARGYGEVTSERVLSLFIVYLDEYEAVMTADKGYTKVINNGKWLIFSPFFFGGAFHDYSTNIYKIGFINEEQYGRCLAIENILRYRNQVFYRFNDAWDAMRKGNIAYTIQKGKEGVTTAFSINPKITTEYLISMALALGAAGIPVYSAFKSLKQKKEMKAKGFPIEPQSKQNDGTDKKDADRAMSGQKGGIDLTPAHMNLQTQNSRSSIQFHLDPAQLQQLQDAPGFVPVIINIQPVVDLREFLGIVRYLDS